MTCGMIAAGLLAFVTVGLLGGWMGGILGFSVGLVLAMVLVLFFWFRMFFYILGKGPSV